MHQDVQNSILTFTSADNIRLIESAHRLGDETKEIGYPKRRRRIHAQHCRSMALARVVPACSDNGVFQDECLSFLLLSGSAADQYTDRLLEVEKPERKLEIVDIDHLGGPSKRPAVFVVRIDQDDVCHRVVRQNGRQEQAHSTGFSGSGGPEHSEMLAQQFVDQHECRLSRIIMERANSNIGTRKWSKNCNQVGVRRSDNGRARNGVLRYTPPEAGRPLVRGDDLSQEVGKEDAL